MAGARGSRAPQHFAGQDALHHARRLQEENQLLRQRLELLENPPLAPGLGKAIRSIQAAQLPIRSASLLQVPPPAPMRFQEAAPFASTAAAETERRQRLAGAVGQVAAAAHRVFEDSCGDFFTIAGSNEASIRSMKSDTALLRRRAEAEHLRCSAAILEAENGALKRELVDCRQMVERVRQRILEQRIKRRWPEDVPTLANMPGMTEVLQNRRSELDLLHGAVNLAYKLAERRLSVTDVCRWALGRSGVLTARAVLQLWHHVSGWIRVEARRGALFEDELFDEFQDLVLERDSDPDGPNDSAAKQGGGTDSLSSGPPGNDEGDTSVAGTGRAAGEGVGAGDGAPDYSGPGQEPADGGLFGGLFGAASGDEQEPPSARVPQPRASSDEGDTGATNEVQPQAPEAPDDGGLFGGLFGAPSGGEEPSDGVQEGPGPHGGDGRSSAQAEPHAPEAPDDGGLFGGLLGASGGGEDAPSPGDVQDGDGQAPDDEGLFGGLFGGSGGDEDGGLLGGLFGAFGAEAPPPPDDAREGPGATAGGELEPHAPEEPGDGGLLGGIFGTSGGVDEAPPPAGDVQEECHAGGDAQAEEGAAESEAGDSGYKQIEMPRSSVWADASRDAVKGRLQDRQTKRERAEEGEAAAAAAADAAVAPAGGDEEDGLFGWVLGAFDEDAGGTEGDPGALAPSGTSAGGEGAVDEASHPAIEAEEEAGAFGWLDFGGGEEGEGEPPAAGDGDGGAAAGSYLELLEEGGDEQGYFGGLFGGGEEPAAGDPGATPDAAPGLEAAAVGDEEAGYFGWMGFGDEEALHAVIF